MSTVNSHLFHQTVARRESASCETSRSAPRCSSAGRRCAYVCWSPWTQLKTVQKYAVVGVFAPSGATRGNVGRFPGALTRSSEVEIDAVGAGSCALCPPTPHWTCGGDGL